MNINRSNSKRSSEDTALINSSKRPRGDDNPIPPSTQGDYISTPEDVNKQIQELRHGDPVLRVSLPPPEVSLSTMNTIPDITLNQSSLLETMMYPLDSAAFLNNCFRKKAVQIKSNNHLRAKYISQNYLFNLDPKEIFNETASDSVFLWIPPSKKDESSNSGSRPFSAKALQSIEISDPDTAHLLHTRSNYASYCRAPPELEQPLVSYMLRDTGLGLGQYDPTDTKLTTLGRGEVETFIGTEGHLTDWHTDFQENFTIQLSGRKKWTLKQGSVHHPIRGTTPHYQSGADVIENQIKAARLSNPDFLFGKQDLDSNAFGEEAEIIMEPGDVLYFPAGMWHKVETLEYGISINISLMGSTYAKLICTSLEHILVQKEEWREVICGGSAGCVRGEASGVIRKLDSLLKELPAILKKFQSNNGAQNILPPVLRQKPSYEMIAEDNSDFDSKSEDIEKEYEDNTDTDDEEEKDREGDHPNNQTEVVYELEVKEKEEGDTEEESIIDLSDFQCPDSLDLSHDGCSLVKNPLASLIRMADVKSYFSTKDPISDKHLYILNVNFAGNDLHESSVRVIFRDTSGELEKICSLEISAASGESWNNNFKEPSKALIFYGYFCWKK